MRPLAASVLVLAALACGCVARDERPTAPASVTAPPFTLELDLVGRDLGVHVVAARPLAGAVAVSITGPGGARVADATLLADHPRRFVMPDARGPWRVVARWQDPRGVAGATAVREIPAAPDVAPRFERRAQPVSLGALRIEAAVPIR